MRGVGITLLFLWLLSVASCGRDGSKGVYFDAAFGPLIPPGSTMLAGVRLDKIRAAPLYKKYQDQLPLGMLDQFKEKTGLDPRRDVWEMVFAQTPDDFMAFARGHFAVGDLERKLDPSGKNRVSYKGHALIGEQRYAVTFLNTGMAAAGRLSSLKSMIDRRNDAASMPSALASRITAIPVDAQLWLVDSEGLPRFDLLTQRDDVGSIVSNFADYVSGASMSVHLDEGIRYEAVIDCKSDEGVKRLKDALRGVIGFARLSTKSDQQDLLRLYDAVTVTPEQRRVRVTAAVSAELVPKLVSLFEQLRGEGIQRRLAPGAVTR